MSAHICAFANLHICTSSSAHPQAQNATTNGGDASRVGTEKGGKYKLYQIIAESSPDARRVAPIRAQCPDTTVLYMVSNPLFNLLYNKVQISSLLLSQLVCHSGKGSCSVKRKYPNNLKHKTLPLMGATRLASGQRKEENINSTK